MRLEELINQRISEYDAVRGKIAVFDGKPAVFYQSAPDFGLEGWGSMGCYPQIIYWYDMQADRRNRSDGTLKIRLICKETGTLMEELQSLLKQCLREVLMKPEGDSPVCFLWSSSGIPERKEEENGIKTSFTDISFIILEYSGQKVMDPDPIMAFNRYLKQLMPEAIVIGIDTLDALTQSSTGHPVIYCRLEKVKTGTETNTVVFMNCRMAVHILCVSKEVRLQTMMSVVNQLALDGDIRMPDNDLLSVQRLKVNNQKDALTQGQLCVWAQYGLSRNQKKPNLITKINMDIKVKENK